MCVGPCVDASPAEHVAALRGCGVCDAVHAEGTLLVLSTRTIINPLPLPLLLSLLVIDVRLFLRRPHNASFTAISH